jgi:uncharacterized protein (TIRG00374 family)
MSFFKIPDQDAPPAGAIKTGSWIAFFILFAGVLGFALYHFAEIRKEIKLLEEENFYWLMAAVAPQLFTYIFTAFIYRFLLGALKKGPVPGLWEMMKASVILLFFNQTVPSVGISGNTFMFNFLSKFNTGVSQIISVILAELLIFYFAMLFLIFFLFFANAFIFHDPHIFSVTLLSGGLVYFVFTTAIILTGRKNILDYITARIRKLQLPGKLAGKIAKGMQIDSMANTEVTVIAFLEKNKRVAVKTFFLQLLIIVSDAFTLYALFYGLGQTVSVNIVLMVLISAQIMSLIPFVPGSLVLYESSMSFFFVQLGVPVSISVIVTLVYRLLSFWLPLPFGLFFYRKWVKKRAAPEFRRKAGLPVSSG